MKMTVAQLRSLVREEYLRGVPEFVLREATRKYVKEVRQQIRKHIEQTMAGNAAKDAYEHAENVLNEFEEEANVLLEDKLWQFIQGV